MQTCMETSCTKLAVRCFGAGGASFVFWRKSAEKPGSIFNRIQKLGSRVSKLVPPGFSVRPEGLHERQQSWMLQKSDAG